jgi:hypothetical protein
MKQDGDTKFGRDLVNPAHFRTVRLHGVFQFADADGSILQSCPDECRALRRAHVGIGEPDETIGILCDQGRGALQGACPG